MLLYVQLIYSIYHSLLKLYVFPYLCSGSHEFLGARNKHYLHISSCHVTIALVIGLRCKQFLHLVIQQIL